MDLLLIVKVILDFSTRIISGLNKRRQRANGKSVLIDFLSSRNRGSSTSSSSSCSASLVDLLESRDQRKEQLS